MKSPNFNDRTAGIAVEYIVLHYTGMKDALSAMTRLCDPVAQVSAHYVIDEDGHVTALVDENKRAWHAGKSFWRGMTDMNSASIGIELINPGHEWGYRIFPNIQVTALVKLLPEIISRQKMNAAKCLLAHSDIAPGRKQDPGEYFPWQELANKGFGFWPDAKDDAPASEQEVSAILHAIGYDISSPREALVAFQRRFHPENLTGIAYPQTVARLRSLKAFWEG